MEEIWKVIEEEPKYEVSNFGNIRNSKTKRLRKLEMNEKGYLRVKLNKQYRVHRLVATAFIDNPENKPEVDHIDGDKRNNRVDNLRWVTGKENMNNENTLLKMKRGMSIAKEAGNDMYKEIQLLKLELEKKDSEIFKLKKLLELNGIQIEQ